MSTWKLWIDDQLDDSIQLWRQTPAGFMGAKNCDEAVALVEEHGPPSFMDLDCDLGDGKDTKTFLKWLAANYPDSLPLYRVHSKNIIEKENVKSFMRSWVRSLSL